MALTFTTPLTLPTGITIENAYGRVGAGDPSKGVSVEGVVDIYASEAAFEAGAQPLQLDINNYVSVAYDRTTMGTDILNIAHDALVALLAEQNITATKVL